MAMGELPTAVPWVMDTPRLGHRPQSLEVETSETRSPE